jgi:hypothetical protein
MNEGIDRMDLNKDRDRFRDDVITVISVRIA